MRYFGSSFGAANTPTDTSARGVWSLAAASEATRRGVWPPYGMTWNSAAMSTSIAISGGLRTATHGVSGGWGNVRATLGRSSGKRYFEVYMSSIGGSGYTMVGIDKAGSNVETYHGANANGYGYQSNSLRWNNGSQVGYGSAYTAGDVIGVALDFDAGTLVFYKNNVSQGTAYSAGMTGEFFPCASLYTSTVVIGRFLASQLTYSPPAGFTAWGD